MREGKKYKTCFLDRDGVLIKQVNYLSSPEQVFISNTSLKALKTLRDNGYLIIVVTNQGGVARGYYSEESISVIHKEIERQLNEHDLHIDHYYYCPHYPDGSVEKYVTECDCRKPMPGMILQAVKDFDIDLSRSFLVGDKVSDLLAAKNAGCSSILVETGHGLEHTAEALSRGYSVCSNLEQAVLHFLSKA